LIKFNLVGKQGVGGTLNTAQVHDDGSVGVTIHYEPPFHPQKMKPFRQYLTIDGTSTGSNDMGVDGSVTEVEFYVVADQDDDRYITELSFLVAYGTTSKPYRWANGAALTNGSRLFYNNRSGDVDIHDAIKSNQDLFRLFAIPPVTGWEIRHTNANNDYGYFGRQELALMMPPFGVKLDAGSTQRLALTIRDDATAAVTFNVIATGFDRFE